MHNLNNSLNSSLNNNSINTSADTLETDAETIAALATAPGRGGIGVIRLSGSQSLQIAENILQQTPKPRYAHYLPVFDEAENRMHVQKAIIVKLLGKA